MQTQTSDFTPLGSVSASVFGDKSISLMGIVWQFNELVHVKQQHLGHGLSHWKCDSVCVGCLKGKLQVSDSHRHRFVSYTDSLLEELCISQNTYSKPTSAEHTLLRKTDRYLPSASVKVAQQVVTLNESKGSTCLVWLFTRRHLSRPEKSVQGLCSESHQGSSPGFVTVLWGSERPPWVSTSSSMEWWSYENQVKTSRRDPT